MRCVSFPPRRITRITGFQTQRSHINGNVRTRLIDNANRPTARGDAQTQAAVSRRRRSPARPGRQDYRLAHIVSNRFQGARGQRRAVQHRFAPGHWLAPAQHLVRSRWIPFALPVHHRLFFPARDFFARWSSTQLIRRRFGSNAHLFQHACSLSSNHVITMNSDRAIFMAESHRFVESGDDFIHYQSITVITADAI